MSAAEALAAWQALQLRAVLPLPAASVTALHAAQLCLLPDVRVELMHCVPSQSLPGTQAASTSTWC